MVGQDLGGRVGGFEFSFCVRLWARSARYYGDAGDSGQGEGFGDAVANAGCAAGDQDGLAFAVEAVVFGNAVVGCGMVGLDWPWQ